MPSAFVTAAFPGIRPILGLVILACIPAGLLAQSSGSLPFDVLLGRPTDHSVALSVLATQGLEIVVDYGTQTGVYPGSSPVTTLAAGAPSVVTLDSLQADSAYVYRIRYRDPGTSSFAAAPEAGFVTQRASGRTFIFAIEADPHYQDDEPPVWDQTLANILADKPDFLVDIGDTFMDEKFGATTSDQVVLSHRTVRSQFFAQIGQSVPLFLVSGNHDPELGWLLSAAQPHANVATWGVQARQLYFPCPVAGAFYSGATAADPYTGAPRDAYYAFQWGDALFIALDPFWYTCQTTAHSKDPWSWTLGRAQYDWLKATLEQSKATFKFVFIHHLVGGSLDGQARGGAEVAPYYEWGGSNIDDTPGFAAQRPGWAMPIQDLLLAHGVTAVFHGHDHLYVRQSLATGAGAAGLIYQEVPQPSRSNQSTNSAFPYGYLSGVMYPSSGHLRVRVSPAQVTVSYVRAGAPADPSAGVPNGAVMYNYTISVASGTAPVITAGPVSQTVSGGTVVLGTQASGSGLVYQWLFQGTPLLNGAGVSGATGPSLVLSGVSAANAGNYQCVVTNPAGSMTSQAATLSVTPSGNPGRMVNLSVNAVVSSELIMGFVTGGAGTAGSQRLLIRASGPALASYGVAGVLPDPEFRVFSAQGVQIAANAGWGTPAGNTALVSVAQANSGAGLVYTDPSSLDSAGVLSLGASPGYTVHVDGSSGDSGRTLAEVYDDTAAGAYTLATPRLMNLSCRIAVPANGSLTNGFYIGGATSRTVLIRAVGPGLTAYGVAGAMPDPVLTLNSGASAIASNAGWGSDPQLSAAMSAVGAQPNPLQSRDCAILVTLPPGSYTAVAASASGAAGSVLVDAYEVP